MSAPTPPKGSLEDLFRHHLLESGAAAVPPRPLVWEQLDTSLLLAQNEHYRRRLRTYRWAVAASLLLTAMVGGGWWHSQQQAASLPLAQATANEAAARSGAGAAAGLAAAPSLAAPHVASTSPTSTPASIAQPATLSVSPSLLASASSPATSSRRAGRQRPLGQAGTLAAVRPGYQATGRPATGLPTATGQLGAAARPEASLAAGGSAGLAPASARLAANAGGIAASLPATLATREATNSLAGNTAGLVALAGPASGVAASDGATARAASAGAAGEAPGAVAVSQPGAAPATALAATGSRQAAGTSPTADAQAADAPAIWSASPAVLAELNNAPRPELLTPPTAEELRMGRDAALATGPTPTRPATLRAPAAGAGLPLTTASEWQLGASYTASAFQPNIDFLRPLTAYDPALGATSAYFTQVASTEFRNHLRAGLGQRLNVWASRRLGVGHWSLRLGAEASHNEAHSASSVDFVGEQVYSLTYARPATPQLRPTRYAYTMLSLPVELRRGNSLRTGWSLYGRVGGALSALFNVRSDVDGSPEAARTYSLTTENSPYRRLTASVRGGLGVQLRPANHQWTFSLGPVAETGIFSLNANPSQNFWHQQRPYSLGLEAGVELGGVPHLLPR